MLWSSSVPVAFLDRVHLAQQVRELLLVPDLDLVVGVVVRAARREVVRDGVVVAADVEEREQVLALRVRPLERQDAGLVAGQRRHRQVHLRLAGLQVEIVVLQVDVGGRGRLRARRGRRAVVPVPVMPTSRFSTSRIAARCASSLSLSDLADEALDPRRSRRCSRRTRSCAAPTAAPAPDRSSPVAASSCRTASRTRPSDPRAAGSACRRPRTRCARAPRCRARARRAAGSGRSWSAPASPPGTDPATGRCPSPTSCCRSS